MPTITQNTEKISLIAWTLMLASANKQLDMPGEYLWNIPDANTFKEVRDKSRSVYSSGNSIKDKTVTDFIQNVNFNKFMQDPHISAKFEDYFPIWIKQCPRYNLKGIDEFKYVCYAQGSQEYFLNYYFANKDKRFRIFKGEYWWHMEVWQSMNIQWAYIEDDDIQTNDVVLCSFPFALTGKKHVDFDSIIAQCNKIGVEVMVDFIYLPNCTQNLVDIDLDYECIKGLSFSFSKTFPVQNAKVAVRMTRSRLNDPMQISNDENVANRLGCGLGLEIMQNFDVDYMVKKYQTEQTHWCKALGLHPTDVVHFAVGEPYTQYGRSENMNWFSEYNEQYNRYNLGPLFENKALLSTLELYN